MVSAAIGELIAAIDCEKSSKSKSQQLADAILKGTPIIVVTIQTFLYAMVAILTETSLKNRGFAVIIDEAHTEAHIAHLSLWGFAANGLRRFAKLKTRGRP